MKIKAGNKIIPLFEKKKAAPVQRPNFSGANPGFPRPTPSFPVHQPMGQKPILRPGPSIHPGFGQSMPAKKEKSKDITQIIANLPKDELAAYVSIIVGLIFILIGVFLLL